MPFLSLVHLRELRCGECDAPLALPGSRSFLVDERGDAVNVPESEQPDEMIAAIVCPNGHETLLYVPNEISAEETLLTPEDAPIALDAVLRNF